MPPNIFISAKEKEVNVGLPLPPREDGKGGTQKGRQAENTE